MKNLIEYRYSCETAIFEYLKTRDLEKLVSKLKQVEKLAKSKYGGDKSETLWFRFFRGDTLATDIEDIHNDLKITKSNNYERLKEILEQVVSTKFVDYELRIFLS